MTWSKMRDRFNEWMYPPEQPMRKAKPTIHYLFDDDVAKTIGGIPVNTTASVIRIVDLRTKPTEELNSGR